VLPTDLAVFAPPEHRGAQTLWTCLYTEQRVAHLPPSRLLAELPEPA
jgi:hypothetical protein